jgi:hypothetical protein
LVLEIKELSRSKPYQHSTQQFEPIKNLLLGSREAEKRRILSIVEIVPIGLNVMRAAITFQETHKLSLQDSIVYVSILDHLASVSPPTSCFITKNSKDFVKTQIENELATYHCRLFTKFSNALGYLLHRA